MQDPESGPTNDDDVDSYLAEFFSTEDLEDKQTELVSTKFKKTVHFSALVISVAFLSSVILSNKLWVTSIYHE